ncbi:MAG: CBS domain-containing protein, partial [Polyangiales bacterium]
MFRGAMRFATLIGPELKDLLREEPASVAEFLEEVHPEDIADIIDDLTAEEAATVMAHIPAEVAAPIFERLEPARQQDVLARMETNAAAAIVGSMASDDRVDLVQELEEEPREKILAALEPDEARDVRALSEFADNTAGGLMTTDFIGLPPTLTVREAIEEIRRRADEVETVYYVYVLLLDKGEGEGDDGPKKLLGVASLRDLLLGEGAQTLGEVMTENVITVAPELDQEEVARTLAKYDLSAVPVVDKFGRLLGVITFDDVMDVLVQEQTE